jgi:signal transduction histidine kinase
MTAFNYSDSSLTRLLARLRLFVPPAISVMGLVYVLGETLLQHDHAVPHTRAQLLIGVLLLSILGPAITYGGLSLALRAATRVEAAEEGLRRQNRHLAILEAIVRVANRSLDPDQVMSQSLDQLLRLTDLDIGAIWLIQDEQLILSTARGVSDEFLAQERRYALNQCLCGYAVTQKRLITLEELGPVAADDGRGGACESFAAAAAIPIRTSEAVIGVLELASESHHHFDSAERETLVTVGHQIGLAVEKAQLHHQLGQLNQELEHLVDARTAELQVAQEELAQKASRLQELLLRVRRVEEETRACIANDLHDGVQQLIAGAMFEAEAIREAIRRKPEQADREIDLLEEMLHSIQSEMRGAIYSLRPVTLDAHGLTGALQECVGIFERTSAIPCKLLVEGEPRRFESEAELNALRIVQEALNNIVAHAGASEASVTACFGERALDIQVNDNGRGFEVNGYSLRSRSQLGLLGMLERAESSGGALRVQSGNGRGTKIRLTLPLRAAATPKTAATEQPKLVQEHPRPVEGGNLAL